ncbi:MAG: ABC transporter permease subunit [Acidimicrobiia bacterium]|nr:ABC transporter permease subunit [Acidimicrobiia bacterium]
MSTEMDRAVRPPLWRDIRVLGLAAQIFAVGAVVFILYILWFNLTNNMARQGITTSFDFLNNPGGVNVADNPISRNASATRFILVGIKNTFALAVAGIPILTIVGVLVGVARLSTNWLVNRFAAFYVESLRNIPPLLVILIAFFAVILPLPPARDPATPFGAFVISNLRISVPWLESSEPSYFWIVLGAVVLAVGVWIWRTRVNERTGQRHHRVLWSVGVVAVIAIIAYFLLSRPVTISLPVADGSSVSGGLSGLGGFFAVMLALSLYTASHVAEIVRGSIQAVPKGQSEAANALALSGFQRLRHVILPQAMRSALPPIINQYLNYVKNTSLAIAVGFAEVTSIVFQLIGNGNPATQLILILMGAYLLFSLTISLLINILNRRLQLVTR